MEAWGPSLYGDPCRECGYRWSTAVEDAVAYVAGVPDGYATLLEGRDAAVRHPDLDWTAGAYVCHVGDNLRIWAERVAGAVLGAAVDVAGYDQAALGDARNYNAIAGTAALWSLASAAHDWAQAIHLGRAADVVLRHATRGAQTMTQVAHNNAHDAYHHAWDIRRSFAAFE